MSTADFVLGEIPSLEGSPPEVLIIAAPYYRDVADGMVGGARAVLEEVGASHETVEIAGAYELPQALRLVAPGRRRFDGFIAIGCVVKGETDHYDFICRAAMDGPGVKASADPHHSLLLALVADLVPQVHYPRQGRLRQRCSGSGRKSVRL